VSGRRRVRPLLLALLWVWALCVFATLDLFLNIREFDVIRPRAPLYQGMRRAAHDIVGEPYEPAPAERVAAATPPAEDRVAGPERTVGGTDATLAVPSPRHGSFTRWNDPPGKAEGEYRNGRRHGTWTWRWTDGRTRETREYVGGKLQGATASFFPDGRREVEEHYAAGKPDGVWRSWYPDGRQASVEHYGNGVLDGDATYWHANGVLRVERRYEDGRPAGRMIAYHENGQKAEEGSFDAGRPSGVWTSWDERGIETRCATHTEHGTRIDRR
jgi:antitoxin component YwqK of YwqJK toxin-antitoxin module